VDERPDTRPWRAWIPAAVVVTLIVAAVGVTLAVRGDEPKPRGLAVLRLTAGGAGRDAAEPAMLGPEPQYRLVGPLPDLGANAPVARLTAPDLDAAAVARLARALGAPGEPVRSAEGFRVEGPTGALEVYLGPSQASVSWSPARPDAGVGTDPSTGAGAVPGCDPSAGPCPDDDTVGRRVPELTPPEALPSAAEAERIARDLLATLGLDTQGWAVEVTDAESGVACAPAEACEPVASVVFQRTVALRPQRNGIPVQGLDWYVTVGDRGRVESVWGSLAALEELGGYPLRTTTEAFEDLQAGRDVIGGIRALAEARPAPDIAPGEPSGPSEPGEPGAPPEPSPPEPVVIDVAGVRLAHQVIEQPDGSGALLVPVYEFLDTDGTAVAAVVAVTRDLVRLEPPSQKTPPPTGPAPAPGEPGEEPPITIGPAPERPIDPGLTPETTPARR